MLSGFGAAVRVSAEPWPLCTSGLPWMPLVHDRWSGRNSARCLRAAMVQRMLFDDVHRFGWPVDKCCLAVDEAAIHRTEVAAVARDGAMVAHHVVAMRRQHDRRY